MNYIIQKVPLTVRLTVGTHQNALREKTIYILNLTSEPFTKQKAIIFKYVLADTEFNPDSGPDYNEDPYF